MTDAEQVESRPVSLNDLSAEGCMALCQVQAIVNPNAPVPGQVPDERVPDWRPVTRAEAFMLLKREITTKRGGGLYMTDFEFRQALNRGIRELLAFGIIAAERNGEGDFTPTAFYENRLTREAGQVVSGDYQ